MPWDPFICLSKLYGFFLIQQTITGIHTRRQALLYRRFGAHLSILRGLRGDPFAFSGCDVNDLGASLRVWMHQ